jgi:hypothetical protein
MTDINIDFKTSYDDIKLPIDQYLDDEWLKSTFILGDGELKSNENSYQIYLIKNRYRTTADYKFTSSAPGMNLSCNPRPQFTRYADLRSKGKLNSRQKVAVFPNSLPNKFGYGMGRYYSRAIDDNAQRIYMTFGVQEYTPITSWLKNSFDVKRIILMNRGMFMSTLLSGISLVASLFAVSASGFFIGIGLIAIDKLTMSSRFYKVSPQMHLYWATVEEIVNQLFAKRTLLPNTNVPLLTLTKTDNNINNVMSTSGDVMSTMHELLPDIVFNDKGRISIFALALKAQSAFNTALKADYDKNSESPTSLDFLDYPLKPNEDGEISHDTYFTNANSKPNFVSILFDRAAKALSLYETGTGTEEEKEKRSAMTNFNPIAIDPETGEPIPTPDDPQELDAAYQANIDKNQSGWQAFKESLLNTLTDGAMFAVFTVDSTGAVGESFSNSFGENPLQSTINGFSSKVRSFKNTIGAAVEGVTQVVDAATGGLASGAARAVTDMASAAVSGATFGLANPVLGILYGANFELPKIWESSSSSLPRASYKMRLFSPYGNAYSQLFNLYVPLGMILAGSLPRGTGSQSYTSPFFCQLFDRGRVQIQVGMIESLSITRGVSNLAFTKKGQTNAIDVDFSVANLDNIIFSDLATAGIGDPISRTVYKVLNPIEKDNAFTDYMAVIAGLDVYNQIYYVPKLRLKLAESLNSMSAISDPAAYGSFIGSKVSFISYLLGNNGKVAGQLTNN